MKRIDRDSWLTIPGHVVIVWSESDCNSLSTIRYQVRVTFFPSFNYRNHIIYIISNIYI